MLSKRLNEIIDLVLPGESLADIGTDHGLVPLELLKQERVKNVIITDINQKPLNKAINLLSQNGFENQMDFRLGNGIEPLQNSEVSQVIIAGMGGDTIANILAQNLNKSHSLKRYILQPMTRSEKLREFLVKNQFKIDQELIIEDKKSQKDRFFNILIVSNGVSHQLSENELIFGQMDKIRQDSDFKNYIKYQLSQYANRLEKMKNSNSKRTVKRRLEFERRFRFLEKINESLKNNPIN